ncbi:MAG: SGNH/GDSL hydrolase family protein [Gammaproteobacteria bacterium]|nr:SGNH/GDSL hydrolase family protein [Gammaproteobacteria bacterium]
MLKPPTGSRDWHMSHQLNLTVTRLMLCHTMMVLKNMLFWVAFPFLIPQALYVRKTAPRFAPADGPAEGAVGDGKPVRLLAIGDSIVAGVGASDYSKALVGQLAKALATMRGDGVSWQAIGVSGYDAAEVSERLIPGLDDDPFDYVFVSVGVNDVTGLTSVRKWRRNLSLLLDTLEDHSPEAVIAVAGIPPLHGFPLLPQPLRAVLGMRGRVFDEVAREVAEGKQNALHLPLDFDPHPDKFAPDGYHPSEESYPEFGRHVAEGMLASKLINSALQATRPAFRSGSHGRS